MTDTTKRAGPSEETLGSAPARRLRRWVAVGAVSAAAVGWLLVLALIQHRSPERTAPAPPAAGEHGDVTYRAVGGGGTAQYLLHVDPAGGAVLDYVDLDPPSGQPSEKRGQVRVGLSAPERAELVDAVQQACQARLRDRYAAEGRRGSWDQTVSFGGRTIQVLVPDREVPAPLFRLIDVLARIIERQ